MNRLLLLLAAVTACSNSPSKLDPGAIPPAGAPTALATAPPGDPEARLARIERRLDKVAGVLDQALGPNKPDPAATYSVPINELDPVEGPRDAKVTIVEGYEFLCPYCYLTDPAIEQVRAKYPNDVRIVSKYLVIHGAPAATIGTYACAAAKQGKFSEMKAALWSHLFKKEGEAPRLQQDEVANVEPIASSVGLDLARLKQDAESCKQWLESSQQELTAVGVNATPAFFVNGRPLLDRSFAGFDKAIQDALARVSASGVEPVAYYEREVVGKGLKHVRGRFED